MLKFEVKYLNPNTVDVFQKSGWFNWTRFNIERLNGKVFLKKVNGLSLEAQDFKDLCKFLEVYVE